MRNAISVYVNLAFHLSDRVALEVSRVLERLTAERLASMRAQRTCYAMSCVEKSQHPAELELALREGNFRQGSRRSCTKF